MQYTELLKNTRVRAQFNQGQSFCSTQRPVASFFMYPSLQTHPCKQNAGQIRSTSVGFWHVGVQDDPHEV